MGNERGGRVDVTGCADDLKKATAIFAEKLDNRHGCPERESYTSNALVTIQKSLTLSLFSENLRQYKNQKYPEP
jgi:hypothetical protein